MRRGKHRSSVFDLEVIPQLVIKTTSTPEINGIISEEVKIIPPSYASNHWTV
jgi:hypothetical protein